MWTMPPGICVSVVPFAVQYALGMRQTTLGTGSMLSVLLFSYCKQVMKGLKVPPNSNCGLNRRPTIADDVPEKIVK
jgi:hypothetical protein